jgi:hypothetical protein
MQQQASISGGPQFEAVLHSKGEDHTWATNCEIMAEV